MRIRLGIVTAQSQSEPGYPRIRAGPSTRLATSAQGTLRDRCNISRKNYVGYPERLPFLWARAAGSTRELHARSALVQPHAGTRSMRPLPPNKSHGIVHSHKVKQEDIDAIARHLGIPDSRKRLIHPGDEVHIVREQRDNEIHTIREAKPGELKR